MSKEKTDALRRNPARTILAIAHAADFDRFGADGMIEPGMVLCVESYIGELTAEKA